MRAHSVWELTMRILVADDEPRLLAAYKVCLEQIAGDDSDLDSLGSALFGDSAEDTDLYPSADNRVDYVTQGEIAVASVRDAIAAGDPYGVLFLDMRMPPGIDGFETARQVRHLDKNINIVIVTGYSDHAPQQVAKVAGPLDKLYYLAKPFETAEIHQLAQSLGAKWSMESQLREAHRLIGEKMGELEQAHLELGASEARSRHIALHDQLTHLPNRRAFQEHLSAVLPDRTQLVSVLFVDLDRFKLVNDTLGHGAGDELICNLAERMARFLPEGAMIARLGGDEFGIVLSGYEAEAVKRIGDGLVSLCEDEFVILGTQVHVGASIGIAHRTDTQLDSSELLRRADLALYAAKSNGRACCYIYTAAMDESSRTRAEIDRRLRQALDADELTLAYQPIIDPDTGGPIGYEALLRWDDEELGQVSPTIFIPIAEETGLVLPLGEWVIRSAIAECAKWEQGFVSINLSTRHFQSRSLVDFVTAEARAAGVHINRIQLEITETALFDDAKLAAQNLIALRNAGIRIALDDFGTGYSSLVNLRDFEIDCIKIDRSFVSSLGTDRQASAIVNSVTGLARSLGLSVVAEGVENATQVQSLRVMGCGLMQGYYYCAPMHSDDLPHIPLDGYDAVELTPRKVA
jgi:diguanylate cyclase (GGDEF)-like protein